MACKPAHPESLIGLRQLREEGEARGNECLAFLLGGVDLCASVGREWELPEIMGNPGQDERDSGMMPNGSAVRTRTP
jgi:hypothetical protein